MKTVLAALTLTFALSTPALAGPYGAVGEILSRLNLPQWDCQRVDHDDNPATRKRLVCERTS